MAIFSWSAFAPFHFHQRIYRIFLAVAPLLSFLEPAYGQENGAYKTMKSGDFSQTNLWAVWNGTSWQPATQIPGKDQDIYIDQNHSLRLLGNEAVKSVFIHAGAGAGQKLNLNGYNLDVYESLAAFTGTAPGAPSAASSSQNWIGNSPSSTLTFKGTSRVIVEKSSWSADSFQSRFAVIFDPGPGEVLTLMAPMKALSFRVRSGTLDQKINRTTSPVCFTLSFNTENRVFGAGPFGDFTVESGATFRSECNANLINRTTSGRVASLLFALQREGHLVLQGTRPTIEAAQFRLDGTVTFEGAQGPITFLTSVYPNSSPPRELRHLVLHGAQQLQLPEVLALRGDLLQHGTGTFRGTATHLSLIGEDDQLLRGSPLNLGSLTVDKSSGTLNFEHDLVIARQFTLAQGVLDFHGNALRLNTSGLGGYRYSKGSWRNLGLLSYLGLPNVLDEDNATFPFEDLENGGLRSLQLLGTSSGGTLDLQFVERTGANHDANFLDRDGTPILYQLHSYFRFTLSPASGNQDIELRISAAGLLVEQTEDLRVVGTGDSAPGTHLPGLELAQIRWGRRKIAFEELQQGNFTLGSFREGTVLPLPGKQQDWLLPQKKEGMAGRTF
jgi:hypothetical protein